MLNKNDFSSFLTIPRNLQQCEACILGKQNKQPFHDSTSRENRKIELIHYDLCGPMLVLSTCGNRYIMTFIDDYTRMCWVNLLKHKSQSFENFGLKMKLNLIGTLCTDNGGAYTSNEFEIYLCQHRIKHQTTIPYNPQQNDVAERMNMTLLNMVCSMLFFKIVKLMFWDDVIQCEMYVRSRSPYHALGNKTPYEIWNGCIASMRHLRVFGSTCYTLIPKEQRKKLGARSRKCIL
jgi:transposase InsO family protein